MTIRITHFEIHGILICCLTWQKVTRVSDVRFPTSLTGDGSDAMSVLCVADLRVLHVLSGFDAMVESTGTQTVIILLRTSRCTRIRISSDMA